MHYLTKRLAIAFAALNLIACDQTKSTSQTQNGSAVSEESPGQKSREQNTYFVISSWITKDRQEALNHIPNQQKQLMSLWNRGLVENIYYNQKGKFSDGQPLSLIACFVKAENEDAARAMLDTTDIVKNKLANYTIRQVGNVISSRSENAVKLSAGTAIESYAVVWELKNQDAKKDSTIFISQSKTTAQLQNVGIIENIYVNTESIGKKNSDIKPAVFIINAKNEAGARQVLNEMPIVKSGIASYGLHHVGQFMSGVKSL